MMHSRVLVVESGASHVAGGVFSWSKAGRLRLEHSFTEALPAEAMADDSKWSEATARALAVIVRAGKLKGACVLGLPGHLTLTKFVKAPAVAAAKREKIVQFEAQQGIPYPLAEVVWDYFTVAEDGLDLEILLAAVKRETLEELCVSAEAVGLIPEGARLASLALLQAFRYNYPEMTGPVLVIEIGARSTTFLFIDGPRFFVRTLALAGASVTQTIAEELGQDFACAEKLKPHVLSNEALPKTSPTFQAVQTATNGFISRLQVEIARLMAICLRQRGGGPGTIYLTGGGAKLGGLAETLAERLAMKVERFDSLRRVEVAPTAETGVCGRKYELAGLIGLAAERSMSPTLDLLPSERASRRAFVRRQPWLIGAAAVLAMGLAMPLVQLHRIREAVRCRAAELDACLSPLRQQQERNRENLVRLAETQRQLVALQSVIETKFYWIRFLNDLQNRLGQIEEVWLDRLQVTRKPAGTTLSEGESAENSSKVSPPPPRLQLTLSGRLVDKNHPVSKVSSDSYVRMKALLASFADSEFVTAIENERFDASQSGILRFDFILAVNPSRPL